MNWFTNLIVGLKSLFAKERVEGELDEELEGYLEASAAHKQNIGMSPEAAQRAVLLELGSRYSVKDQVWRLLFFTSSLRMVQKWFIKKLDSVYVPQYA
jgi:hypothetical protein